MTTLRILVTGATGYVGSRLVSAVTPPIARSALGLLGLVPGSAAAALRTGLDTLINPAPKASPA